MKECSLLPHRWTYATSSFSELEQHFKKYRGGVVLRGDVEEDSVPCAILPELGSPESQMAVAKVLVTLLGCAAQSKRRSVRLHPSQNGRRSNTVETSQI